MEYQYNPSFIRDVKKANNDARAALIDVIHNITLAENLSELSNVKKLKGHKTAYRIKVKDYRLCFYYDNNIITMAHYLPRKDVYRFFP